MGHMLAIFLGLVFVEVSVFFIALVIVAGLHGKRVHVVAATAPSRAICRAAFGVDLPWGWSVAVSDGAKSPRVIARELARSSIGVHSFILGECHYHPRLISLYRDRIEIVNSDEVETLIHELVHVLCGPSFKHGSDFEHVVENAMRRLWAEAMRDDA